MWNSLLKPQPCPYIWRYNFVLHLNGNRYKSLVVRFPQNCACGGRRLCKGAEERFVQVLSPLPLGISAQELATTQSLCGKALDCT
ncbi:hypothetical protein A6769_35090 [Nostoc punctiforme NIES-2108]|uniref:Uncharacterized protein n=1 Tax=Nostoc punctiforme NIES-2108 TaxID=1356359 RepID=A0A367R068_NOSPU|nr:hypothetical protein A6769_35090 [Nostoc punctiforme NIES-2108]